MMKILIKATQTWAVELESDVEPMHELSQWEFLDHRVEIGT